MDPVVFLLHFAMGLVFALTGQVVWNWCEHRYHRIHRLTITVFLVGLEAAVMTKYIG